MPQVAMFALYKVVKVGSNADNLLALVKVCAHVHLCTVKCV